MSNLNILIFLDAVIFMSYGILILTTSHMIFEFDRYKLSKFRMLTGFLELFGGLGLFIGVYNPYMLLISSVGLATLMLLGALVRFRVKDPIFQIFPAIILMGLNIYLAQYAWATNFN